MHSCSQSRWSGLRSFFTAHALPAVLALAALAVSAARADVVLTRTTGNGEGWAQYSATFTPTQGGTYTLGFTITGTNGGVSPHDDHSMYLDDVRVTSPSGVSGDTFKSGFESPTVTAQQVYPNATYGDWVFANFSGIIPGVSGQWGPVGPKEGNQRGFVQAVNGSLSNIKTAKTFQLTAGQTYTLTYWQASRSGPIGNEGVLTYAVSFDYVPPAPINWVNWTGSQIVGGVTKYIGQIIVPRTGGGTTTVNVKYTPPPRGIAGIQTSGGTDFWAQGQGGALGRNPLRSPYTSSKVVNIPDGGGAASDKTDIIRLQFAGTNTLEFTDASTGSPVAIASPIFAYVSLNGNGYGFDQDFDILSFGDGTVRDQGFFGNGTSFKNVATVNGATQYQLLGTGEPHGSLQFRGSFSTVTWQSLSDENWNGFTIGVAQLAADIPIANAGLDQTVDATSASGASVQLSGSVSGSTKTPFTFSWSGDFGTASGSNPTVNLSVGTHTISLTVTDAAGASDTDTVVITVVPNPAPVITSPTNASAVYGAPFSYTITATNSPTTYGAANLPAGLTFSGNVISGTPTETGIFGVNLTAQNTGGTGTATLLINIAKANATVTVNGYSGVYDGAAHGATGSATGVSRGEDLSALLNLGGAFTDVPGGTANWSFHDPAGHYNDASGSVAIAIAKADASITVDGYTGIYDGAAHGATGSVTGVHRDDLTGGLNLGAAFTDAPGGTANWTFKGGINYNDASGTASITIAKAPSTTTTSGAGPFIYDGTTHAGGSGAVTGINLSASATSLTYAGDQVNAGTYTVTAHYAGDVNHTPSDGDAVTITIDKAPSTTTTIGAGPFTYDGMTHAAGSGTVTGVNLSTTATSVTYSGDQVNAGSYTVTAHYAGDSNHNASDGAAVTVVIDKASSTTTTIGADPFTYDGATHAGGSGTVTGVNLNTSATSLTYSGDPVNAGSYTVTAHYAGDANHSASDGLPVTISIDKANATIVVTPYAVQYDGQSHSASVASITGVNGETGATVGTVALSTDHTNAGTYTDSWTFTGAANYNDIASTTIADAITKANATVIITPYSVTYDGHSHSATVASITGVNDESGATVGTVALSTDHTNAGTYTDSWTFTGAANYNDIASTTIADTIAKANPAVVVAPYGVTYDGHAHSAGVASIAGVNGETGATVGSVTLNTTHTNAGTYNDSWSFAGAANYNDIASTTIVDTIAKANPSVVVTPYSVTYNGQSHSATVASIAGVNGESGATVGTVALNTDHTNAGTYTDSWSFTGAANYNNIASTTIVDTIAKANATVVVTPYSVIYDGGAHSATVASIAGVHGETGATVGSVSLNTTHTNVGGYADTWSFTGAANYNDIGATAITDTINQAATKTTLGALPSIQAVGQPVTLTASVTSLTTLVAGSPDGTVTFTLGSTVLGTGTLNGSGVATLTTTAIPLGPQSVAATYGGSSNFIGSAASAASLLIYGYPTGGGTFVIGDGNAAVGASVTFWGSQWEKANSLSGGTSNASFKGFAGAPVTPVAGGTFSAAPGNSGHSPASVPAYLGVIVTSKVTKSGSSITGNVVKLVVVKTNPGYADDPGHAGTGTVVAVIQ